ncbi:MAG: AAA family ATPase [Burkholderiaceae bacterium]|nr:AAA family ATPase [Burkholderiaceae bacterium]
MSKALIEYRQFLKKEQTTLSDFEKRLARLILDNFPEVEACGTAAGKRGKLIAKLVEAAGDRAPDDLSADVNVAIENLDQVTRLTSIRVENFRGFSSAQTLEFKNPYTFVYGPNGTGKSSLCEALEFGLLGSINEASAKRIDVAAYIRNSITGKSSLPVLLGETTDGKKDAVVQADSKRYEFCFVEKNRIDGFARVAANTTTAQQARLAALFGLDEFNTFSTQFNDHFENYLDCTGKRSKELADKEKLIAGQKAILAQLPEKEAEFKARRDTILLIHPEGKTLDEVKEWISGTDGNGGAVKANHAEIARLNALKRVQDPGIDAIIGEVGALSELIRERKAAKLALSEYKDQLSLGELYSAILKNREKTGDNCPACESPLYEDGRLLVPVDPYDNATEKLRRFDVALKQEVGIKAVTSQLDERWPKLSSKVENLPQTAALALFPKKAELEKLRAASEAVTNSRTLEDALALLTAEAGLLREIKSAIVAFNEVVGGSPAEVKKLEEQNAALAKILEEIIAIKATEKLNAESASAAASSIEKFNEENEALIKQAQAEKPVVERNMKFLVAYESFRDRLLKYNSGLPLVLAAELNERALKFYNAINKHDHVSDRLRALSLPTATGKKIEIEYTSGQKCDALHVLSEGHIRCLGLSILLAKIVRDGLPFLIFDDVVNSIDDEHRSGIVDLLLGDEEIRKRQLIITTHGEDFVKRLENAVPKADYKTAVCRIDFLVPVDSKKILVRLDSPRHYLVVAERSFEEGRVRDCLSYVRKSFEELLNRLWKKIGNKSHSVQIQLGLRGPGGSPDLMTLANGLHAFLSKKDVTVFQGVIPSLAQMIGRERTHAVEWAYLNKGTHEEGRDEEFDAPLVREMLAAVMEIDAAIEADGKVPVAQAQAATG